MVKFRMLHTACPDSRLHMHVSKFTLLARGGVGRVGRSTFWRKRETCARGGPEAHSRARWERRKSLVRW